MNIAWKVVPQGQRTIGQKISQELQIYQQTLLKPKGSKSPRNLQQIINKKLTTTKTYKDYIGTATPPNHPRQGKRSSDTLVTKRPATGEDPDLEIGNKVDV